MSAVHDSAGPDVFDPQEDAEWLPGELEYYEQLCAEIYLQKAQFCAHDEKDGNEGAHSAEEQKSDTVSQDDIDTTQDSEY